MEFPSVFIIVVNWKNWSDTIECLESLLYSDYPNYRIIIIDNHSTNDSIQKIKLWAAGQLSIESKIVDFNPLNKPLSLVEYSREIAEKGGEYEEEKKVKRLPSCKRLVLIKSEENLGYAGGNNIGIRYAIKNGSGFIWLLNNDTIVDPKTMSEMVRYAKTDDKISIIGCKLLYYDNPSILQAAGGGRFSKWQGMTYLYGRFDKENKWNFPFEPDFVSGASLFLRSSIIKNMKKFLDESLFMYWEEVDWQLKLKKLEIKLLYVPEAKVYHKGESSQNRTSILQEFFYTKNAFRMLKRYFKWGLGTAFFIHLARILKRILKGDFRKCFYMLKGLIEGMLMPSSLTEEKLK